MKEKVREHSIETRRELLFLKNDKKRIRVRCVGCVPLSGLIATAGLGIGTIRGPLTRRGLEALIAGKNDPSQILCPWLLVVGRDGTKKGAWTVRIYNDKHTCLQSRALNLTSTLSQRKLKIRFKPIQGFLSSRFIISLPTNLSLKSQCRRF